MDRDNQLKWIGKDGPLAQGPAKQHEFSVYLPAVMKALSDQDAKTIVDPYFDEATASLEFVMRRPENHSTFVIPPFDDDEQTFRKLAEKNATRAEGRITLVASLDDIADASVDAILFNNLLGGSQNLEEANQLVQQANRILRPGGQAIVTEPNAPGISFSSYFCRRAANLQHGDKYDFIMTGDKSSIENMYLTDNGLRGIFEAQNFVPAWESVAKDLPYEGFANTEAPAFRQSGFLKP